MKRLLGGAGVALGLKLLTGVAVAAFAVVVAGSATEVAVTGSLNPQTWGQGVTQAVQTCKDTLRASGTRGIGQCVSAIAKQHGQQVSDTKASKARENNGNGNGKDKTKDKTKDNSNGNGGNDGNSHKPTSTDHPGPPPVQTSMLWIA